MKYHDLWHGDLHIHTNLSFCAPQAVTPASYLPCCEQEQTTVLGFSNHLYSNRWMNAPDGVGHPGLERVLSLRPELEKLQKTTDRRLLLGCEVEIFRGQEPTLPREEAHRFDYVLIAASHAMNVAKEYVGYDLSTPDKLRDLMLERFEYACHLDYPAPTGICHPLYAIGSPWEQEVIDGISDSRLADCFTLAQKKNISIEIHACLYRDGTARNEQGISPSYIRMLQAAKACGCHFHFGADAHEPKTFTGVHDKLRLAARAAGIGQEDMWKLPDPEADG